MQVGTLHNSTTNFGGVEPTMTNISFTRLSIVLASLLGLSYTLCVLYDLVVPASYRMYPAWEAWLPGFQWLTWGSFVIGLGEVLAFGIYAAALYLLLSRLVLRRAS